MPSHHLTLRIDADAFQRLDSESRRTRRTRSDVARTLIEEGLRMESHPGIVFRDGPAGRRAGLNSGPDVWEVMRVYRDVEGSKSTRTSELTGVPEHQVIIARRYYSEYQDEINNWIRMVDEGSERAEAAWRLEQDTLSR